MKTGACTVLLGVCLWPAIVAGQDKEFRPGIPKVWDDDAIATLEVPSPQTGFTPRHVPSSYYYQIPVRPIYRSYPVYRPGKEPSGYKDWLRTREPEIAFSEATLQTPEDCEKAGELVFQYPIIFTTDDLSPEVVTRSGDLFDRNDVSPFERYVVRKKGSVERGFSACADCHTRVMADGSVIVGAQGNRPLDRIVGTDMRMRLERAKTEKERQTLLRSSRKTWQQELWTPWVHDGPLSRMLNLPLETMAAMHEAIPSGVFARQRSSIYYPPAISDLIGLKDIRYLDRTGLIRHRGIGDLMRYAAMNQGADMLSRFGHFVPWGDGTKLPPPTTQERYSDAQLYALARYIYSLKPPPNPNTFDSRAAAGEKVFKKEGCGTCHTPPLFTNNKLTPALGFKVPQQHLRDYDILPIAVGTDPGLTLSTRRGTGYYKVPSLRGVWYRGPFEHNGSVMTLDEWFNPERLRDDFASGGFTSVERTRAVKGHEFGMKLPPGDRASLIAYLNTL